MSEEEIAELFRLVKNLTDRVGRLETDVGRLKNQVTRLESNRQ